MGTQSEIFNKYRTLQKANNVDPLDNPKSRELDDLGFVEFLFELLKSTKGKTNFKNFVLKGVLSDFKSSTDIDGSIKDIVTETLLCGYSGVITQDMTTEGSGIDIRLSEIDPFNLLDVDPNSSTGQLFYDGNDDAKHINYIFNRAQSRKQDKPIEYKKNGKVLFSLYSPTTNVVNLSFGSAYKGKTFVEWFNDYNSNIRYFNLPNFFSMLVDIMTGTLSIKGNKSAEQIKTETKGLKLIEKIFGFCSNENDNTNSNNTANNLEIDGNSFNKYLERGGEIENDFDFSPNELYEIDDEANLLTNNKVRFKTCGNLELPMDPDFVSSGLLNIFNQDIPNVYNDEGVRIFDNDVANVNVNSATNFIDNLLNNSGNDVVASGEDVVAVDLPNMKMEFEMGILKQIPYSLMKTILTPKLLIIFKLGSLITQENKENIQTKTTQSSEIGNNTIHIPNEKSRYYVSGDKIEITNTTNEKEVYTVYAIDDGVITTNRPLVKEYDINSNVNNLTFNNTTVNGEETIEKLNGVINAIGSKITDKILKNIFEVVKKELINMGKSLLTRAIKQRLSDYTSVLSSLLSLLTALQGLQKEKCSSMLSNILGLLSINIPKPALPMPPMLTLAAGALKPGMNEVVAINDMKTKLEKHGINTSQVNLDGSPNTYILGLEAVMSTMIKHIKTSASIQTEVLGSTGPSKGYSQIQ